MKLKSLEAANINLTFEMRVNRQGLWKSGPNQPKQPTQSETRAAKERNKLLVEQLEALAPIAPI